MKDLDVDADAPAVLAARIAQYLFRRAMMNGSTRNQGCFPAHVGWALGHFR